VSTDDAKKLLGAARDLRSLVEAGADDETKVPDATMRALVDAELHAVMTPREVGGSELDLTDVLDVFTEVSYADGSAGWCLMASASATAYFGAWGGDDFAAECFGAGVPLAAGQFAPNGVAHRDPSGAGWRVTGDYQFGSNIAHAQWVGAGVLAHTDDGGDPALRFALFPADRATRTGNWDVLGLRATASEDYQVRDVFVPDGATFDFFAPTRFRGGPVFDFGVLGLTAVGHSGFALGVTRRALDELVTVAQTKQRMGAATALHDSERFLHELGTLESRYRAARAWVYEVFAAAQRAAEDGALVPSHVTAARQATVHVTQEGADITRQAYLLAGTTALRAGRLQRCFRDMHAGSQHFFASPAAAQELARELLAGTGD
jgi:alkylation response protein AidB-like acyl-CoA dehydrogenase